MNIAGALETGGPRDQGTWKTRSRTSVTRERSTDVAWDTQRAETAPERHRGAFST